MNKHILRFQDCPHCVVSTGEGPYDFDIAGCEACDQTGVRQPTALDLEFISDAKEWLKEIMEPKFANWLKHVKKDQYQWSIDEFYSDQRNINIKASRYAGCNEYDYEDFTMPVAFMVDKDLNAAIERQRAEELRLERIAQEQRIVREAAERKRREEEKERHERSEWERLNAKFGNPKQ